MMLGDMGIDGYVTARELRAGIKSSPAMVVQVRVLPVASMFPRELEAAAASVPYQVSCAVVSPQVLEEVGVTSPRLGEVIVFAQGRLLGRIGPAIKDQVASFLGLLRAGLSPWLARADQAQWDDDDSNPFRVIGVSPSASFEEVRSAWRQRLAEYHPDRFARAGSKIRDLAESESQRINAAFAKISGLRSHEA